MCGLLQVSNMAHSLCASTLLSWRVPAKALSLVVVAWASLTAPRERAMPRITRPTQTIDLGMQPTDLMVWAGDKRPL